VGRLHGEVDGTALQPSDDASRPVY